MPEADRDRLAAGLRALEINSGPGMIDRLLAYQAEVRQWNRSYNLVSAGDLDEFVPRHVLDCAAVLPWVRGGRWLDAGTGAGLPGIPLAILQPDLHFVLADSVGKKVRFLSHVKRTLPLQNIEPVHCRLENWMPESAFDGIISRAFASTLDFAATVRHLCTVETKLLAMKGKQPGRELTGLPDWLEVEAVMPIHVPGLHADRHLVMMSVRP